MRARVEVEVKPGVYEVLKPSLRTSPDSRSRVDLSHEEGFLVMEIESRDPSSMRAALNTWLRLVNVASQAIRPGRQKP